MAKLNPDLEFSPVQSEFRPKFGLNLTITSGDGGGLASRWSEGFAHVRLGPVGLHPAGDEWVFFTSKPGHREVEVRDVVV